MEVQVYAWEYSGSVAGSILRASAEFSASPQGSIMQLVLEHLPFLMLPDHLDVQAWYMGEATGF